MTPRPVELVEHKTTTADITPGSGYWTKLTLDDQVSVYFAGGEMLGYEPRRMMYDVIKKVTLKPYKATPIEDRKYTKATKNDPTPRLYANQREVDETPQEYEARILADIAERPEAYFQRLPIVRLASELHESRADTWMYATQIVEHRRLSRWPRNPDNCEKWGKMCDFWAVCSGTTTIDNPEYFQKKAEKQHKSLPLLSTSGLSKLRRCPRLYYFSYELRIEPRETKAKTLRFGSLFHLALEAWWKSNGNLDDALNAMMLDTTSELDLFDLAQARALMLGYHARWSDTPTKTIDVESSFEGPLVNPETGRASRTFCLGGKIDAVREVSE